MAKTIKATHRLRRPHSVFYDPQLHFLKKAGRPEPGVRVTLPKGTHMIPSETQLTNLPDRFESLSTPEPPAEVEVEVDDEDGDGDGDGGDENDSDDDGQNDDLENDEDTAVEDDHRAADAAVDAALEAVSDDWSALTSPQLRKLAEAYELEVQGTGSGGNVLKVDWIQAVQGARGATA